MNKDASIKEKVIELFFNRFENADQGINVSVNNGLVTLSGIVDVLSEKILAEEITRTIHGIKGVKNVLTISMDGRIQDTDITQTLLEQISSHPHLKETGISADTKKGIVYLKGQVDTLNSANTVQDLASNILGVKEIINLIEIKAKPETPNDDATLVNKVETAFVASNKVAAQHVDTSSKNGVVYLDGSVKSLEEKKAATHYASTVPGVKRVVNRLSTFNDKH